MLDFVKVSIKETKKGIEIKPSFIVKNFKDLMIRGSAFYAIWDEDTGLWSTDEKDVARLVDKEIYEKVQEYSIAYPEKADLVTVSTLGNFSSGAWLSWKRFVASFTNNFHKLDDRVIFLNQDVERSDYASKRLPYSLSDAEPLAYNEIMDTLYDPDERAKLEWAIGAIFTGASKHIQKFIVLYGEPGSGKSTFLNIVQDLFCGYYTAFDAKTLASGSSFAIEAFKDNPLVAIQHDGDLSRIADNTKLNSIVSHEVMTVNEKFKSAYANSFDSFLFMGTNRPVMITEAKSGIVRRLIDVKPSGRKLPKKKYDKLVGQTKFELGAIANHCINVFNEMGENFYNSYRSSSMMGATNDMYNFVYDHADEFLIQDSVTLKQAWSMYKAYVTDANIQYPFSMKVFREELKSYFKTFEDRVSRYDSSVGRSVTLRSVYSDFLADKVGIKTTLGEMEALFEDGVSDGEDELNNWLIFKEQPSVLDEVLADCPAQYAEIKEDGSDKPYLPWAKNTSKLKDLDTHMLHYVKMPPTYIFADFDIKDENGEKSFEKNLEAAREWPPTYAELSKSGAGIHLHYIYTGGDPNELSGVFGKNVEIKVQKGNSALRRKLTKCNNLAIAKISSGLPLKEDREKMISVEVIKTEKELVNKIQYALAKKTNLGGTKSNIDYIKHILDQAYETGLKYDVTSLRQAVLTFATKSTHQAGYCIKMVDQMHFKSDDPSLPVDSKSDDIIFLDTEVFPNLFIVCWKFMGKAEVYRAINPDGAYVENLFNYRIVGFNNRKYDNHILWARYIGFDNDSLYTLSRRLVSGSVNAGFAEAYNLSYADVYDFSSKKQSLKKWEIELGIHHQENAYPWDQPVPEDKWNEIADYCANDVLATEKVFDERHEDFVAREILASISGLTVNDTTRMHTTKIIFGDNKHPELVYTDLSKMFPGYTFDKFKRESVYCEEVVGEGGYVYAEPGVYGDVALMDIASMHPHSIIALNLFGEYTSIFKDIVDARIAIKHHDYEKAKTLFDGKLAPYLGTDEEADALASALKIVINSVYGFTTAKFDNPFKDPRNVDNIVAKRGALFMVNLKHEVQKRGFTVAHIKTDSIKIPDATPEIIQFVMDYGKQYGYTFEHEATYEKMCLVNDAVYIAKYKDGKHAGEWTATGTQFQIPYVFKTLFSHEPVEFKDMCETKTVTTAMYLDMNEDLPEDEHNYVFVGRVGLFTPVKPGCGGGNLYREKDGKYSSVGGTKGYRWLESETVKSLHKEDCVDESYYISLADKAKDAVAKYVDFDWFVSDNPYDGYVPFMNPPAEEEELPFK